MGRISGTVSVTIDRTPQEVFDYLRDVGRHAEWSPRPYRIEGVEGPVSAGTTFTSYGWVPGDDDHRNDVEVTAYDEPNKIEFTGMDRGEPFVNTFVLSPTGSGTKVDKIMDMPRPGGIGGAMFPIMFNGFIKPANGKGMKMLKQRMEA